MVKSALADQLDPRQDDGRPRRRRPRKPTGDAVLAAAVRGNPQLRRLLEILAVLPAAQRVWRHLEAAYFPQPPDSLAHQRRRTAVLTCLVGKARRLRLVESSCLALTEPGRQSL